MALGPSRLHDSCSSLQSRPPGHGWWVVGVLGAAAGQACGLPHGGDHAGGVMGGEGEASRGVHGRGRGQHMAGVAERGDVAQRGHVARQRGRVERTALGELLQGFVDLFALFGFARHLPVPGLDTLLLHRQGSVNLNKDQFFLFLFFTSVGRLGAAAGFVDITPPLPFMSTLCWDLFSGGHTLPSLLPRLCHSPSPGISSSFFF